MDDPHLSEGIGPDNYVAQQTENRGYNRRMPRTAKPIAVVLIEPQPLMVRALRQEFRKADDIELVGTATTGAAGLRIVNANEPDIAVVAYPLPDMTGPQFMKLARTTKTAVIFLSSDHTAERVFETIVKGARGYLLKSSQVDIPETVRRVYADECVMCSESLTAFVSIVRQKAAGLVGDGATNTPLTAREREVLALISEGYSQPQIAAQLGLAPSTTRSHTKSLYKKLKVNSKASAVREGIRRGFVGGEA